MFETQTPETQTAAAPAEATKRRAPRKPKAAPAEAAAKAAEKPAAEAPAKTAPADQKLRWLVETEHKGGKDQSARVGTRVYEIKKTGDAYTATLTVDGHKPEVLSDTTFSRAYGACVARHRAEGATSAAA